MLVQFHHRWINDLNYCIVSVNLGGNSINGGGPNFYFTMNVDISLPEGNRCVII